MRSDARGAASLTVDPDSFEQEQLFFDVESTAVPGQRPARADDSMARNDDRNRIGAIGSTDRPRGAGQSDPPSDLSLGDEFAERDGQQRIPHLLLERSASGSERKLEHASFSVEVFR